MRHLLVFTLICLAQLSQAASTPNVIYIIADDLGYGDLSVYGQTHFSTPSIDAIAKKGILFKQHYSAAPVCAPARGSLMTGLHVGHGAVRGNSEVQPEGQQPMPADTFTLAHMFKKAGYATGAFGKWGLGAPGSASEPMKMGFDRFYGFNCQRMAHHYYPYSLWSDHQREMLWGNFGLETQEYAPDLIQEHALRFVENNKDRPFFLYYAMIQPHAEMFAPEKYLAKYRGKFPPEKPYEGVESGPEFRKKGYGSQTEPHAAFAAMLETMDENVGALMAKLGELGIADNTLIIFTSDNGPHQEGGHDPDYFKSSGGLRGHKRDLYEGGIRVPMIACWPGKIPAGTVTDHISAFHDVLPTMADLTGQPTPKGIDGISFLPTLLQKSGQHQHDFLYWEFHELNGRVAIRKGNWKGVRYNVAVDPTSPLELYDLAKDPSEADNVAAQNESVVRELDQLIKGARTVSPIEKFNFPRKR
ncbi:MAG: arylsulfatase [Planctomycetes bacterium]|nr:arylsulfatase [Planctomycetota bacterium]